MELVINSIGGGTYNIPVSGGECVRELLGQDLLKINVDSSTAINFAIGDWLTYNGCTYTLNALPKVVRNGENRLEYEIQFEGLVYELGKAQFLLLDGSGVPLEGDFDLMGNVESFVQLIADNMNRVFGAGTWALGEFSMSDYRNLTFSGENCLSVLKRILDEYEEEFEITVENNVNVIHVRDVGTTRAGIFEYGRGKGLYKITRTSVSSKNIITRLYAYGSDQNLGTGYRDGAKRLKLPATYHDSKIEDAAAIALYGVIEGFKKFEDIKPSREGSVTSIDAGNELKFTDSTMFNLNETEGGNTLYLIPGVAAKVKFNTGNLAGYEFELSDYNHASRTFTIKRYTDERGAEFPGNSAAFQIGVGDKYVLLDIVLPQSYIDTAESSLETRAQEYLDENKQPRVSYNVDLDSIHVKENALVFNPGDKVTIKDNGIGVYKEIRVTEVSWDLIYPEKIEIKLAEEVTRQLVTRLIAESKEIEKIVQRHTLNDPAKQRRNWMTVTELKDKVFDQEDYFDTGKIKPLSVDTQLLSVGAKSSQFVLSGMVFTTPYSSDANKLNITAGVLTHYAIADTLKGWNFSTNTITLANNNAHYLYAKCTIENSTGEIIASETQYKVDEQAGFYLFLVGVLHSVADGYRYLSLTYGSTSIYGRTVKTGVIESNDGLTKFDLDGGEISGVIKFRNLDNQLEDVNTIEGYAADYTDHELLLLENSLGTLAYDSLVLDAMQRETIILGGFLNTAYLDADFIKASVINADYLEGLNLNFEQGVIGGFNIQPGCLSGGSVGSDRFVLYPQDYIAFLSGNGYQWSGIGANVFPDLYGAIAVARFENNQPNPYDTNYALYAKATGGRNNIAGLFIGDVEVQGNVINKYFNINSTYVSDPIKQLPVGYSFYRNPSYLNRYVILPSINSVSNGTLIRVYCGNNGNVDVWRHSSAPIDGQTDWSRHTYFDDRANGAWYMAVKDGSYSVDTWETVEWMR